MLKKTRVTLAAFCLAGFFLLFFLPGLTGIAPGLQYLAKIQLIPALLAGSFIIVAAILVLTLFFGRVYCSVICPLGLLQDLAGVGASAKRFRYSSAHSRLRLVILLFFLAALLAGLPLFFSQLEPYSIFGRIAANVGAAGRFLWDAGMGADDPRRWMTGLAPLIAALIFLGLLVFLAAKYGRLWCGSVCPVGTFLGCLSRFSLFRIRIDESACVACGSCEKVCKASCMDAKKRRLDASRCVACFNCLSACHNKAISFAPSVKIAGLSRKSRVD